MNTVKTFLVGCIFALGTRMADATLPSLEQSFAETRQEVNDNLPRSVQLRKEAERLLQEHDLSQIITSMGGKIWNIKSRPGGTAGFINDSRPSGYFYPDFLTVGIEEGTFAEPKQVSVAVTFVQQKNLSMPIVYFIPNGVFTETKTLMSDPVDVVATLLWFSESGKLSFAKILDFPGISDYLTSAEAETETFFNDELPKIQAALRADKFKVFNEKHIAKGQGRFAAYIKKYGQYYVTCFPTMSMEGYAVVYIEVSKTPREDSNARNFTFSLDEFKKRTNNYAPSGLDEFFSDIGNTHQSKLENPKAGDSLSIVQNMLKDDEYILSAVREESQPNGPSLEESGFQLFMKDVMNGDPVAKAIFMRYYAAPASTRRYLQKLEEMDRTPRAQSDHKLNVVVVTDDEKPK